MKKAVVKELKNPDSKSYYFYKSKGFGFEKRSFADYADYEVCLLSALEVHKKTVRILRENYPKEYYIGNILKVYKRRIQYKNDESVSAYSSEICATYFENGSIVSVGCYDGNGVFNIKTPWKECNFFFGLYFEAPLPFKKGDIVCSINKKSNPFIFDSIAYEKHSGEEEKDYNRRINHVRIHGNETDMSCRTYYISDPYSELNNALYPPIYCDNYFCWFDIDYYDGELTEDYRTLVPVSNFIKGKIDIELLIDSLFYIKTENFYINFKKVMKGICYNKEDRKLAGLEID